MTDDALADRPAAATASTQPPSQPPSGARALAPDLARGLMLLLIALANVPWHLWSRPTGLFLGHPADTAGGDLVWQVISIITIDMRSYPLFAFLFGYGMWQLYSRQVSSGADPKAARGLLLRRNAWMIAFGAVHALLLWMGDVVGTYGLVGVLVTALFLKRSDRTLRVWCIVLASLMALGAVSSLAMGIIAAPFMPDIEMHTFSVSAIASYPLSMVTRLGMWALLGLMQGFFTLAIPLSVLLAILAARQRVLEEPGRHLPLLRRTAVIGLAIGWAGGGVFALQWAGVLGLEKVEWAFVMWHSATGVAAGLGYVALFALIAHRVTRRGEPGQAARAVTAVGKRSLTCYLLQSVLFAPVLNAWGLGLGQYLSPWQAALYAVVVWLVTVVVAVLLDRSGRRGPAEWLLRRLAYGKPGRRAAAPTPVTT